MAKKTTKNRAKANATGDPAADATSASTGDASNADDEKGEVPPRPDDEMVVKLEEEPDVVIKDEKDVAVNENEPPANVTTEETLEVSKESSKDKDDAESTEKSKNTESHAQIVPGQQIIEPGSHDVLLGRGKPFQNHSGNQRMLQLVDLHREEYNATERASKHGVIERLIHHIKSNGGRFLERIDEGGNEDTYWSEVPHATAYKKMSHALRSKHRNGDDYPAKKAKGQSTKGGAALKGNNHGGPIGANNGMPPSMMMPGFPMGGPMGYPAMMMGNMMGMGPGVVGPGPSMMANPMFQYEMQRAYFAQQEHMMQQQRMWSNDAPTNNNNGGPAPASTGGTGDMTTKAGEPRAGAPPPGAPAKDPGTNNTADV